MSENQISIRVWGDFACFTRPEMKVERVSYPIMTPSAARGILEAIFWEPQMYYIIESIRVVKKGRWVSFRRNEVESRISVANAMNWMKSPDKFSPIQSGGGAPDGTQRNMLALEDVEYIVTAQVNNSKIGQQKGHNIKVYFNEIERRAKQGKCYHRPALGVREFAAYFHWESDPQAALERRANELNSGKDWRTIWSKENLGLLLYDVFEHGQRSEGFRWFNDAELINIIEKRKASISLLPKEKRKVAEKETVVRYEGRIIKPQAAFFNAIVKDACMDCHPDRVRIISKAIREE